MAEEEDAVAEATAAEEVAVEAAEEESTTGISTAAVAVDGEDEAMASLVAATEAMRAATRSTSRSAVVAAVSGNDAPIGSWQLAVGLPVFGLEVPEEQL